ncbi:MAG: SOS response-associated peptidase family protein [Pseudomonadota bacterium]|nr:SOS response-associated peptidase family protein [Pseudomonadota bacterium]
MCNDYGNDIAYAQYVEAFADLRIKLVFDPPRPNLEPRDEIWPSEKAPIIRSTPAEAELVQWRWGLGERPGAPPVINMRSEGKSFAKGRCLIPASHYFEFTGKKSPKTRWRFTRRDAEWFCFAGITGRALTKDGEVPAFSMLTAAPGPDTAEYHNREPVIVERQYWQAWLNGENAKDLLHSSKKGSLVVVEAQRPKKEGFLL